MPNNIPSWKRRMKNDPNFFDKYQLNTNPVSGPTYIPKGTKVESPNKNNPNRFKNPDKIKKTTNTASSPAPKEKSAKSSKSSKDIHPGLPQEEYRQMYLEDDSEYVIDDADDPEDDFIVDNTTPVSQLSYNQQQALYFCDFANDDFDF